MISRPICVTAEGSAFFNLKNLQHLIRYYLRQYLTGRKGVHFDIVSMEHSTVKGAAIAGFS